MVERVICCFVAFKERKRKGKEWVSSSPPSQLSPSASAAVETLKCNVCISSQLLKSLPLSPSAPFSVFLHTWLSAAHSVRNGENTAGRQLKYDPVILSRLRASLQQCDISI